MTDCPFCAIIDNRAPADILDFWPDAIAITPLNPCTPGHTLIIPRLHVPTATEDLYTYATMSRRAALWAKRGGTDCNIIVNVGPDAGQTVGHLHIHVVPRRPGDELPMPWNHPAP